jgi:CheY-like chemotaxis protein
MEDGLNKKLILVIDDEPDVVTYLSTFLSDNGYATESASDGQEAMEKVKANKPDLITLDMSMPKKSGVRFYRELKDDPELSMIPVLVVTAVTGYGGKSEGFEKFLSTRKQIPPPDGFIAKPIVRDEMLAMVKELIASRIKPS